MCVLAVLRRIWLRCPVLLVGLSPEFTCSQLWGGKSRLDWSQYFFWDFLEGQRAEPGWADTPQGAVIRQNYQGAVCLCAHLCLTRCLPCARGEDRGKMSSPRAGEGQKGWSRTRGCPGARLTAMPNSRSPTAPCSISEIELGLWTIFTS